MVALLAQESTTFTRSAGLFELGTQYEEVIWCDLASLGCSRSGMPGAKLTALHYQVLPP